jgi:hypothetical protein
MCESRQQRYECAGLMLLVVTISIMSIRNRVIAQPHDITDEQARLIAEKFNRGLRQATFEFRIAGKVVDLAGKQVPGTTVTAVGRSVQNVNNEDKVTVVKEATPEFTLSITSLPHVVLNVSAPGYISQTRLVDKPDGNQNQDRQGVDVQGVDFVLFSQDQVNPLTKARGTASCRAEVVMNAVEIGREPPARNRFSTLDRLKDDLPPDVLYVFWPEHGADDAHLSLSKRTGDDAVVLPKGLIIGISGQDNGVLKHTPVSLHKPEEQMIIAPDHGYSNHLVLGATEYMLLPILDSSSSGVFFYFRWSQGYGKIRLSEVKYDPITKSVEAWLTVWVQKDGSRIVATWD